MSARALIAAVCILVALVACVTVAHAGTYEVKFCDGISASGTPASPDGRGFAFATNHPAMHNGPVRCPTNGARDGGMVQRNLLNEGLAPYFALATATFTAPPGAIVRELKWRGVVHRSDCHWTAGIGAGGRVVAGLVANRDCGFVGLNYPTELSFAINAGAFHIGVVCGASSGCPTSSDPNSPYSGLRALIRTYSARIQVDDWTVPEFQNVGGGLAAASWVRGSQSLSFDAVDNVGIRATRFAIDGSQRAADDMACDFAAARPCPSPTSLRYDTDTTLLSEGEHRATVTAVDTAGNEGVLERTFLVDNTAPARPEAVTVAGASGWRRTNSFDIAWTNPDGQRAPIVAAHYSLCPAAGGTCARGSRSGEGVAALDGLQVPGSGDYVLRVWLEDAAGNADEQAASDAVHLRFDDRSPTGSFDALDPGDPLAVRVSVTDEHAGLAAGEIELQRTGAATWRVLSTQVEGSRLVARIDDTRLGDGEYTLRARAIDAAGNVGVVDRRADGSAARLRLPLRVVTAFRVGVSKTIKRRGRRRGAVRRARTLVRRTRVRLGGRATIRGRLGNRDREPIAGAAIEVYGRSRSAGAGWEPLATLATDRSGAFRYRARAARSRRLRFVYRGSPVVRPAVSDVTLVVPSATTFAANRRTTVNGGRVKFSGRLRGRPLPPGGKLLELQAHYRGRWRTFATPRANDRGEWSYSYKFGATIGTVVYPFRAVIPRDDLYPFARGRSRAVRVTVRGR